MKCCLLNMALLLDTKLIASEVPVNTCIRSILLHSSMDEEGVLRSGPRVGAIDS